MALSFLKDTYKSKSMVTEWEHEILKSESLKREKLDTKQYLEISPDNSVK